MLKIAKWIIFSRTYIKYITDRIPKPILHLILLSTNVITELFDTDKILQYFFIAIWLRMNTKKNHKIDFKLFWAIHKTAGVKIQIFDHESL